MRSFEVAVVGLGAFGSATLYNLSKRGIKAIGLEQFEPTHDRGSSHGESRVIRLSYYENPGYVPLLREAYKRWEDLDDGASSKVLTRTGILEAGFRGSALIKNSLRASKEHDIEHTPLSGDAIGRLFPGFNVPGDWQGLYQKDGGFLRPEMAIRRFVAYAERNGAVVSNQSKVVSLESEEAGVRVRTAAETIIAKSVVVTAGAWVTSLISDLGLPLTVTRQTIAWYDPVQAENFAIGACPVFILDAGKACSTNATANVCYGFPNFDGTGVKIASHAVGPEVNGSQTEPFSPAEDPQVRMILKNYMKGADGECLRVKTCLYTNTEDGHFLIDRSPTDSRIIVASPCSGHGFKFASVIGDLLSEMALRRPLPFDLSGFSRDAAKRWISRPPIE